MDVYSDYGSGSSLNSMWNSDNEAPQQFLDLLNEEYLDSDDDAIEEVEDEGNDLTTELESLNSSSVFWHDQKASLQTRPVSQPDPKLSTYTDLVMGKCTLEDVRREFEMNGLDCAYNPDEPDWRCWAQQVSPAASAPLYARDSLVGMGPGAQYLRQKSWPEPERSPAARLPRPRSMLEPLWKHQGPATSTPIFEDAPPAPFSPGVLPSEVFSRAQLTEEQARVLRSLPDSVLYAVLRRLRAERHHYNTQECRFCKNNGERPLTYRSHVLKDEVGRVTCPVLRAFTCSRCGARGDSAHTIKYCPLSTNEERLISAGMMRSVRKSSAGRRRHSVAPSVSDDGNLLSAYGELDPRWAALEQRLLH